MPRLFQVALALSLACSGAPARPGARDAEPTAPCEPEDCGPAPVTSPWLCADGKANGPTGRCLRNPGGSCRWEMHTCSEMMRCGGVSALACPDGHRCVDDPRDECDPSEQGSICPGLCVRK